MQKQTESNLAEGKSLSFQFEPDEYMPYLDATDLNTQEKQALLQVLWSVVCEFVMLGWNIHPVQSCKKDRKTRTRDSSKQSPDGRILLKMMTQSPQNKTYRKGA